MTDAGAPEKQFSTLTDLVLGLGYDITADSDVASELEDYAESYLVHDTSVILLDWTEDQAGESIVLAAEGVTMWNLQFPVTLQQVDDHLDQLDDRIGRVRIIEQLPGPDEEEDDPATIVSAIALLFGVDVDRVRDDLGTRWTAIESGAIGTRSNPRAYLRWADHVVVGIDDEYVYLFSTDAAGDVPDAYADGILWEATWTREGAHPDYADFAQTLRDSAKRAGKLPLPRRTTNQKR